VSAGRRGSCADSWGMSVQVRDTRPGRAQARPLYASRTLRIHSLPSVQTPRPGPTPRTRRGPPDPGAAQPPRPHERGRPGRRSLWRRRHGGNRGGASVAYMESSLTTVQMRVWREAVGLRVRRTANPRDALELRVHPRRWSAAHPHLGGDPKLSQASCHVDSMGFSNVFRWSCSYGKCCWF
jgi:hypothetical protein